MKLELIMDSFTLWGKDKEQALEATKRLLDEKHFLKLRMTSSTALANDLYTIDCMAQMWNVQMEIDYEIDESYSNRPARVIVHLNPNYGYDGKSKSESDE